MRFLTDILPSTGATGYVGGTILTTLTTVHPEYEITALVRNADQASKLKAAYPAVTPFIGNLDDGEGITRAASSSSIIVSTYSPTAPRPSLPANLFPKPPGTANADHDVSVRAFLEAKPNFLIHISGGALLPDVTNPDTFGNPPSRLEEEYSDIDDFSRITSFHVDHLHRLTDDLIISSATTHTRTAIVNPPAIYGPGTGAFNTKSIQVPVLAELVVKKGKGFYVGAGGSEWSFVHVVDLAGIYLKLVEAAVRGGEGADWFGGEEGGEGYYFAESETIPWKVVAEKAVEFARKKGVQVESELESFGVQKVNEEAHAWGAVLWGTNAIQRADRARKTLGWVPKEKTVFEVLEAEVEAAVETV